MGTGEMDNAGRQALSLSLTGAAEVFYFPLGACHLDSVCCLGWDVDLEKFRGKCWLVRGLGQTERGSSCNSPTLSTQHTQCQRAPALLSLQTKQNPSRSCAEILCSGL